MKGFAPRSGSTHPAQVPTAHPTGAHLTHLSKGKRFEKLVPRRKKDFIKASREQKELRFAAVEAGLEVERGESSSSS